MFLDCRTKLVNPEETHKDTGRNSNLNSTQKVDWGDSDNNCITILIIKHFNLNWFIAILTIIVAQEENSDISKFHMLQNISHFINEK